MLWSISSKIRRHKIAISKEKEVEASGHPSFRYQKSDNAEYRDHVVWRTVYLYADQCYYVSDSNPCHLLPGDQRSFVTQSDLYRLDPAIRTGDSKQHVRGYHLLCKG